MHEALAKMVAGYQCRELNDYVNALREILQEIALLGLWRSALLSCRTSLPAKCTPFSVENGKVALRGETGMTSSGMLQTILNCTWSTLSSACARQVTGKAMIL